MIEIQMHWNNDLAIAEEVDVNDDIFVHDFSKPSLYNE